MNKLEYVFLTIITNYLTFYFIDFMAKNDNKESKCGQEELTNLNESDLNNMNKSEKDSTFKR